MEFNIRTGEASVALRGLLRGFLIVLGVISLASFAYWINGWSLMDSIYHVVVTVFGIGYGEVRPIETPGMRWMTIGVILAGTTSVVYLVGHFLQTVAEGVVKRAMNQRRQTMELAEIKDHTIICGFGRLGQVLAEELKQAQYPFVVIDKDPQRCEQAHALGYLLVEGEATEEESLEKSGIERATCLAAVLPSDTINVFVTLTARNMNTHLRIIARGQQPNSEKKMRQAGANEVVLPSTIGAFRIAQSITRPTLMHIVESDITGIGDDLAVLGLEMDELQVAEDSPYVGESLKSYAQSVALSIIVLAIRRGEEVINHPADEFTMEAGDRVVALLRRNSLHGELRVRAKKIC
jgi:voltage-gated potassium channel